MAGPLYATIKTDSRQTMSEQKTYEEYFDLAEKNLSYHNDLETALNYYRLAYNRNSGI